MVVEPPFRPEASVTTLSEEGLYVYRVISILSDAGREVIACAARSGGVVAGDYSGPQTTKMRTATASGLDVIDICPLTAGVEVACRGMLLGRDGRIMLFRDVLTDDKPVTMKFKKVQGTAYRLLSHSGDLYVLTSKGLYVLGKLASRFLARELYTGVITQILTAPMDAIDANLAGDRWLLAVLPDEVRRFDAAWIHDNVPEVGAVDGDQDFQSARVSQDWQWNDVEQTARELAVR